MDRLEGLSQKMNCSTSDIRAVLLAMCYQKLKGDSFQLPFKIEITTKEIEEELKAKGFIGQNLKLIKSALT